MEIDFKNQTKEYSELNTINIEEKATNKAIETEIFSEQISENDFRTKRFITSERWSKTINLWAKIIKYDKHQVTCECLIDKENMVFETRTFSSELFRHLPIKSENTVVITIRTKAGSSRIDVHSGKGVVNNRFFEIEEGWNNLKDTDLGKPIRF